PRSLSLLQSKCPKRGGGAILVDRAKHCWTFSLLATLMDETSVWRRVCYMTPRNFSWKTIVLMKEETNNLQDWGRLTERTMSE
uniref:Uncharacterized protein n=1 Tax=Romanomermis culicivorax TaxID=13658 RepID=A0A915IN94_ROMCU